MKALLSITVLILSVTLSLAAPQNLKKGLAIKGYDPVAYSTEGKPTKGSSKFTATHEGATYRFSSAAHRDTFKKHPSQYIPQYGGYCAYGVGKGKLVKINPEVFLIHNGKLYLQLNRSVAKNYATNLSENIATSNKEWTKLAR